MICAAGQPTFRLLDAYVGWDVGKDKHNYQNLTGLNSPDGVQLARLFSESVDPAGLLAYLPPPQLARGCGPCEWYLVTPGPASRLLRRSGCSGEWQPLRRDGSCLPNALVDAVAVATRRHRVAVADASSGMILIWTNGGERLASSIKVGPVGPIAFTPWGELLLAAEGASRLRRFSLSGEDRGELPARLPGTVDRLAVGSDCAVWVVTREEHDTTVVQRLWRAERDEAEFKRVAASKLASAFQPTGIVAVAENGFCFEERGPDGLPLISCYSWYGRTPLPADVVGPAPSPLQPVGQLLTLPLDSGLPRCHWHRVRIDADVPAGTTLSVTVATSEKIDGVSQGDNLTEAEWELYPAGYPHPDDWQSVPAGATDFLIDQPPGRYLFLRMRLTGDGRATPVVRRIRLDFPRHTSLEHLPAVYRDTPPAEDFTERFLSLFDATIADLDRAIERSPALLDVDGVPDEVLPWLGSFLDLIFEGSWPPEKRRRILRELPNLYRWRGTVTGLFNAIKLVFEVEPVIEELAQGRSWGALGRDARLRTVKLFGTARARFHLGSSALSRAPLRSFGNPDNDPLNAEAYRFRVLLPSNSIVTQAGRERLLRLVESQKPAHTLASIRVGGGGWVTGISSSVGVDTVFGPLPPPVLGAQGNVRLNRMSVLWSGPRGLRSGFTVGETAAIGIHTLIA